MQIPLPQTHCVEIWTPFPSCTPFCFQSGGSLFLLLCKEQLKKSMYILAKRSVPWQWQHEVKATLEADNLFTMSVLQLFPAGWKPLPFWQLPSAVSSFRSVPSCPVLLLTDSFTAVQPSLATSTAAGRFFPPWLCYAEEEEGWQLQLVASFSLAGVSRGHPDLVKVGPAGAGWLGLLQSCFSNSRDGHSTAFLSPLW